MQKPCTFWAAPPQVVVIRRAAIGSKLASDLLDLHAAFHLRSLVARNRPKQGYGFDLRAAEKGHPSAMALYGAGLHATRPDEAMRWRHEAASRGDVRAPFDLALIAYHGPHTATGSAPFSQCCGKRLPTRHVHARPLSRPGRTHRQAHELWVEADDSMHYWLTLSLAREAKKPNPLGLAHRAGLPLVLRMELRGAETLPRTSPACNGVGAIRPHFGKKQRDCASIRMRSRHCRIEKCVLWHFGGLNVRAR